LKLLFTAYLAVPAIFSAAQPTPHAAFNDMIVQKLGLTQVQKEAARQVILAHKAALHAKLDAAFRAHADLFQALPNPETTPAQIQALESKYSAADLAIGLEINQVVKEIAPSLTVAQIAKAQQLTADARSYLENKFRSFFLGAAPAVPQNELNPGTPRVSTK
jgi:hypothetical protein